MFTWTICTITALVLIVFTVYYLFNNKKTQLEFAFLFLMAAGFFAYLPHYLYNFSFFNAIICDIVNLFQIVTLNSNSYETYQPETSNHVLFALSLAIRGCVHIVSPILGVTALYRFLKNQIEKLKSSFVIRNKKNIYIFSCYNEKSQKIAEDIAKLNTENSTIIFYETEKIDYELDQSLGFNKLSHISRKMKLDVKANKLPKIDSIKSRVYYFLLSETDDNTELGLRLEKYYNDMEKSASRINKKMNKNNIHITVFSENASVDEKIIDSIETSMDLRVVYPEKLSVYKLLDEKPLYRYLKPDSNLISVLIVGFNGCSKELLCAALCCGQMVNTRIKFNIICDDSEKVIKNLNLYYPELLNSGYDINFYDTDVNSTDFIETLKENCMDTTYVAVCGEDDLSNIGTAIELRKFFLKADGKFTNEPFIAVKVKSDERAKILNGDNITINSSDYKLHPFGNDKQIYNYHEMIKSDIESLAKRVHLVYSGADTLEAAESRLNDYYKWERDRKSNLSMALSIRYKLYEMGFDMIKCQDGESPDNHELENYLNKMKIEKSEAEKEKSKAENDKITEIEKKIKSTRLWAFDFYEHERWMAYQRSEGVCTLTPEEAKNMIINNPKLCELKEDNGIILPRTGKSITMMLHMDICEFDDIEPRTKDVNEMPELKSYKNKIPKRVTTVYDEQLILSINKMLCNDIFVEATGGVKYKAVKFNN